MLGALVGGAGVLVYLAGWLIIPQEGEEPGDQSSGWLVAVARACAVCLALVALAALTAGATLFGFGWAVVGVAALVLVAVLVAWPRMGPAWALLPLAAIALPAAAVAASGIQLVAQVSHVTVAPRALAPGGRATFRAGLGTLLVDLRRTALPATGVLDVSVQGGVRRTIVALPHDRCVHVDLHYAVKPFWAQVASQFAGREPTSEVVLFGAYRHRGGALSTSHRPGPDRSSSSISRQPAAACTCATFPIRSIPRPIRTGPAFSGPGVPSEPPRAIPEAEAVRADNMAVAVRRAGALRPAYPESYGRPCASAGGSE